MDRRSEITPELPVSAAPKERGRFHNPFKYAKLTLAAALSLALGIACSPAQGGNINITESPIVPTATATAKSDLATATVEPSHTATSTPEAKKIEPFDCKILSPEACATGEYIQWNRPDGQPLTGIGFKLDTGEKVRISENLVVAGFKVNQPDTYNGYIVTALNRNGTRKFNYFIGNFTPLNIGRVGIELAAETTIGRIGGSDTVFKESNHNLIVLFPSEADLKGAFSEQTKNQPIIINNESKSGKNNNSSGVFFDVKPPQK